MSNNYPLPTPGELQNFSSCSLPPVRRRAKRCTRADSRSRLTWHGMAEGSLSPLCTSQQQDLPSPSTTATLDPHREAIKGRWTDSDKDDLARIAPPLLKADRGWEEISRALPRRRSANAAKARFYQIAEERDELSTWRRQTKRGNGEFAALASCIDGACVLEGGLTYLFARL